ncbi:MAG TPA: dTMP kinase [Candidatus Pacearchaeota archaeon]|nr:dTMP kinase [Candidatus Pacearchaeota archaeon]
MKTSGKFIVIEGIDGCGGETQTRLLSDFLNKNNKPAEQITFPQYDKPIGKLIHEFLYNHYDFNPEVQTLLYFSEFVQSKENIKRSLKEGKILISDRYFTSTLAYQGLRGMETEKMLQLSQMFDIIKPDLTILLRISAETSVKRKIKEKGENLDRNEKDCQLLKELMEKYDDLAKKNIFCSWAVVDGEKTIEEVFNQLIFLFKNKLNI